jgi:hypothetical protein
MRKLNAVIQLPERGGSEYYVFAGKEFARIKITINGDDSIQFGPHTIKSHCSILKETS